MYLLAPERNTFAMRLRQIDPAGPGIRRQRCGRGFRFLTAEGRKVDSKTRKRIKALVIPPAWTDVWICQDANGHIQAVGTAAAGRRQYLYHSQWRIRRAALKHERVLEMARALPRARRRVAEVLRGRGLGRGRVLAGAFRLLDLGFFRIGSESYAEDNGSVGLATMRREHIEIRGATVYFDYPAKGMIDRAQRLIDPDLARLLRSLVHGEQSAQLLAYRAKGGVWRDLRSEEINEYIRDVTGCYHTAKDFRTWSATVLMAQALAASGTAPTTKSARKRAVARAVAEVAQNLGNTPAVARRSYINWWPSVTRSSDCSSWCSCCWAAQSPAACSQP